MLQDAIDPIITMIIGRSVDLSENQVASEEKFVIQKDNSYADYETEVIDNFDQLYLNRWIGSWE